MVLSLKKIKKLIKKRTKTTRLRNSLSKKKKNKKKPIKRNLSNIITEQARQISKAQKQSAKRKKLLGINSSSSTSSRHNSRTNNHNSNRSYKGHYIPVSAQSSPIVKNYKLVEANTNNVNLNTLERILISKPNSIDMGGNLNEMICLLKKNQKECNEDKKCKWTENECHYINN